MHPDLLRDRSTRVSVQFQDNTAQLRQFWAEAVAHGWRMSWRAWKNLALSMGGWGVIDNDSGFSDDTQLCASAARDGFNRCTVGPARHFKSA